MTWWSHRKDRTVKGFDLVESQNSKIPGGVTELKDKTV